MSRLFRTERRFAAVTAVFAITTAATLRNAAPVPGVGTFTVAFAVVALLNVLLAFRPALSWVRTTTAFTTVMVFAARALWLAMHERTLLGVAMWAFIAFMAGDSYAKGSYLEVRR